MGLAEFYGRAALAASQVVAGFDESQFRRSLERTAVGVAVSRRAAATPEGRVLLELLVRLVARLYPAIEFRTEATTDAQADYLAALARAINPRIDLSARASLGVSVGTGSPTFKTTFWAGSRGWDGLVSRTNVVPVGSTQNPFGAAVAACLAAGEVFKQIVLPDFESRMLGHVQFSTFDRTWSRTPQEVGNGQWTMANDAVMVGIGAIGNAAAWTLAHAPLSGTVHLVDNQTLELSNLQRYVLSQRDDVGRPKVDIANPFFAGKLHSEPHCLDWSEFVEHYGHRWDHVLVAVDSAADRRSVQASLPAWVTNAWTQPGDIGVSCHGRFDGQGACLSCLYLPEGQVPNEDELVAQALGVPNLVADVRTLLHSGAGVGQPLLQAVASSLNIPTDQAFSWEGRPIRELYAEGICGGALIPMGANSGTRPELHVPLAHQSALAGVLLASAFARHAIDTTRQTTTITRIDVLGVPSSLPTQPAQKARTGECICEDSDYLTVFNAKYPVSVSRPKVKVDTSTPMRGKTSRGHKSSAPAKRPSDKDQRPTLQGRRQPPGH